MSTPTTPNTFYRFRSIDALLDKYQELESQTIYFASPDQLNDPMEGFRDIVWRGDKIVWTNFFKHFIYCLLISYLRLEKAGASEELGVDDIPILGRWDQISTPQAQRLFDDIWHRFLNLPKMPEVIEALASSKHKIRYRELECYLRSIQYGYLSQILGPSFAHELISESERQQQTEVRSYYQRIVQSIPTLIIQRDEVETEEKFDVTFRKIEELNNNDKIIQQLNILNSTGKLWKNRQLMILEFSKIYLNGLERLLWPKWYTACFMKDYRNSSVWGHYGNKHRGACLIFESLKPGESNGLNLYHEAGQGRQAKRFYEVDYADKPGEVDFFRSIGQLTGDELEKIWYTDDEGNESECGKHVQPDGATFGWQQSYWDRFYHDITTKTKDWEYEQEYRLILNDVSGEYDDKESRKLIYDFSSLKGIIFGIRTSDESKLRVIEILVDKCKENDLTDFKFYQAYYSSENGDIRKYELPVDFS